MNSESEFYVGYLPMPRGLRRSVRAIVIAAGSVAAILAVLLVAGQHAFPASSFEFGQDREFQGYLLAQPYPALAMPGQPAPWLLVAPGKHGVGDLREFDGQSVHLKGERIAFGNDRMIEVLPGSIASTGRAVGPAAPAELGRIHLTGEIVDSKCYFGVMNPGNGKVHRDCAARCISGGVPPAFLVRDSQGTLMTLLLANWKPALLRHVAEPIRLQGHLVRAAGRLTLQVE